MGLQALLATGKNAEPTRGVIEMVQSLEGKTLALGIVLDGVVTPLPESLRWLIEETSRVLTADPRWKVVREESSSGYQAAQG